MVVVLSNQNMFPEYLNLNKTRDNFNGTQGPAKGQILLFAFCFDFIFALLCIFLVCPEIIDYEWICTKEKIHSVPYFSIKV